VIPARQPSASDIAAFAQELEKLVANYGHILTDNQIITALEEALSTAWSWAGEPQPASLFEHAPDLLAALKLARSICHDAFKDTGMEWDEESMATIDAAISRAEGR